MRARPVPVRTAREREMCKKRARLDACVVTLLSEGYLKMQMQGNSFAHVGTFKWVKGF